MDLKNTAALHRNLFFLLMFCFAAAILGDSTAEALLLARFGTALVPKMFLVNAAALFVLSAGMLSVVDKIDRRKFFLTALLVHAGMLLLVRVAILANVAFLFLPLFSYAYGTKILFFLLFWTIANDLIDSRSAGKAFPAIAAGGTVGAIGISFSIPALMRFFTVENLLLLWTGLIVMAVVLLVPLGKYYKAIAVEKKISEKQTTDTKLHVTQLALLLDNPLLRNMSLLYAMVFFILLNQHYIFYQQIKNTFPSAESIASFLGQFNGVSMLLTGGIQVVIAGIIMKKLGSTRSMLLLPVALLSVFSIQIIVGYLTHGKVTLLFPAVIAGMGVRIAFFDAFFSPNFQLFFSSLPKDIRGRGKLCIEGAVKPLSMIIAGTFLLLIAPRLNLQVHFVILAVIAAFALIQTIHLKNAYTQTLTRYLTGMDDRKNSALLERFEFSGGEDFVSFFAKRLDGEEYEIQKFLIEIITSTGTDDAVALLIDYLPRADSKLKATIVSALGNFPGPVVSDVLKTFLSDADERVVANAVTALHSCRAENLDHLLEPLIDHSNRRVKINVMLSLWDSSEKIRYPMFIGRLTEMLYSNNTDESVSALYLLGQTVDESTTALLYAFCKNKVIGGLVTEGVHRQTVRALGMRPTRTALELLLQIAHQSTAQQKKQIIAALGGIIPQLHEHDWLAGLEKGNAVYKNCLLSALRKTHLNLSSTMILVLNRVALRENEAIEWERKSLNVLAGSGSGRIALLSCALREELISVHLDNLIQIVAVLDGSGVITSILPRLHHTDRHVRARVLEVFENTGDNKLNRVVIDHIEWFDSIPALPPNNDSPVQSKEKMIAGTYCTSHNRWVAICAAYACGHLK